MSLKAPVKSRGCTTPETIVTYKLNISVSTEIEFLDTTSVCSNLLTACVENLYLKEKEKKEIGKKLLQMM